MLLPLILVFAVPHLEAVPVADDAIAIDGRSDEAAWSYAPVAKDFTEQSPSPGADARQATDVRVLLSDNHLFVAATVHTHGRPQTPLSRRDEDGIGEWLHLDLDSFGDRRSGYRFSLNPANVQRDARVTGNGEDRGYDAVWRSATRTSSMGWTIEAAIPLSEIRYRADGGSWGFQVTREHADGSVSRWSPTPQNAAEPVSYYGALEGVAPAPRRRPLVLRPVAVARLASVEGSSALSASAGLDAQLALGDGFTVDLTVLPDFGQVEADPSNLNLGASELFLQERRPFFAASREYLGFGLGFGDGSIGNSNLFYSRRLGATPIAAAARLSGKAQGWTVGIFDAMSLGEGDTPASHATAARIGKTVLDGKLTLSTSATHLHRFQSEAAELPTDALTGGVEAEAVSNGWIAQARVFGSRVSGTQEALQTVQNSAVHFFDRPDAEHVSLESRRELAGWGVTALLAQVQHNRVRGAVGAFAYSPGLEVNDLGFLPRADQQLGFAWLQLRHNGGLARSMGINFNVSGGRTFGSEFLGAEGNMNGWWTTEGRQTFGGGVAWISPRLSPTALFGGPALHRPARTSAWLNWETDPNANLRASAQVSVSRGAEGELSWDARTKASWRPRPSLELSLAPRVSRQGNVQNHVGEDDGWLVADLDRTVARLEVRGDWTVTPDLSVAVYAAPYLSAGKYSDGRKVADARNSDPEQRFSAYSGNEVPEAVAFDQVRANAVVRWAYAPGSALTLAWAHEQTFSSDSDAVLGASDFSRLLGSGSEDRVVLKLSHRLAI